MSFRPRGEKSETNPKRTTAQPWAHECWTAGAAQRGIGLRAIIFAPLDGAKFMSPRFYRGRDAVGEITWMHSCVGWAVPTILLPTHRIRPMPIVGHGPTYGNNIRPLIEKTYGDYLRPRPPAMPGTELCNPCRGKDDYDRGPERLPCMV